MGDTLRSRFPNALDARGVDGNFPGLADRKSFFLPVGKLIISVSSSAQRFTVGGDISLTRVPEQGIIRIDDEIIAYQRIEGQELVITSTVHGRGMCGTTPAAHTEMADVMWLITSAHFDVAYDALVKVQQKVGVDNSQDKTSLDWRVAENTRLIDGGENAFLCDTFTLTDGNVANKYVELRQAAKTGSDIMVLIEGGPSIHPGRGFFVEEDDPYRVKWLQASLLTANLAVGDVLTVMYRAKAPAG